MNICRAIAVALLVSLPAVVSAQNTGGGEPASAAATSVPPPPPANPAPAAAAAAAAVPPAPALIGEIDDEELMEILREEGYAPAFDKPGVLRTRIESLTVLFFVAGDGRSVQAFTGFRSTTASLETVNAWNRSHRYSRAYLDPDGDPVVELDLDLAGGIARERLLDYLRTVRVTVLAFVKAVSPGSP